MPEPAQSVLLSACIGALIGLIRQWEVQQGDQAETEFAGLRTFAVIAMLGAIAAYVSKQHAPIAFAVALGVLGLILAVTQFGRPSQRQAGYTTAAAALLTFFCGGLVSWQERQAAVLVAALTMLLLGLKRPIHQWTRQFTMQDVRSALQFVAITGVILPIVPNRNFGPFEAFNPWSTWLMVVFISGLGFLGYLLVRLLGSRAGITLTGLVGGLASSTATTLSFSRRSREDPGLSESYALAIVLACNVMLARVLVVAAAISLPFARGLILPLLAMALPGLGFAGWMWLGRRESKEPVEPVNLTNPLSLATAVKFAALYAFVKFLVKAAIARQQTEGVVVISAIAGLTDVDAITLSMTESAHRGMLAGSLATTAVVVGCISNTLVKAGIAAILGSPVLRKRILVVLGATAMAGAAGLLWIR